MDTKGETVGMNNAEVNVVFDQITSNMKRIQVMDNGPGLPESKPEVVFEDGFSTKSIYLNSHRGLGLAIVSKIIDEHGGQIFVESEPAKGSVFRILLPCVQTGQESGSSNS